MANLRIALLGLVLGLASVGCEDDTCEWGDKTYKEGDSFPAGDGCNICGCGEDGQVSCTAIECQPKGK